MQQIKFEDKDGITYILVEGGVIDCDGCAFNYDQEACENSPDDCVVVAANGAGRIWVQA
jgi:hypothetical protein